MRPRHILLVVIALSALGAGGYALHYAGMQAGMRMANGTEEADRPPAGPAPEAPATTQRLPQGIPEGEDATRRHIATGIKAGDVDPAFGKKVLYYHDPMVPGNKFDKPAKSPFMDMMLVPVYADSDTDSSRVTVSSRIQQNLGVRTAPVVEGTLAPEIAAVGNIAFNERDQVLVQARATGFVERLYVRATLDRVAKGEPLAEFYVPEWIAAQEEFLSVQRMRGTDLASLVDGARQRMRQVGMSDEQIAAVERDARVQARFALRSPIDGVITELMAREGMTVMAGASLFRINGLSTVWANAEVPESQAALVRPGTRVEARSPAAPGTTFTGRVQAIVPEVNPATRTLKARVELGNPGYRLVPGMFVQLQFMDKRPGQVLLVPTEAIIQTGKRTVILLAEDNGRFRPVDVDIGIETGGQTEIRRGLRAGQRIVVSSQFLIDSEASLKGIEARLNAEEKPDLAQTAPRHSSDAKVESVGPGEVTLSHGPIPSLQWGPMTMDFKLPKAGLPPGVTNGKDVRIEFFMDADGLPQITAITPQSSAAGTTNAAPGVKP